MRQLEGLGHDPADVRHIITTHLDLDHAGGIGDFPEAQIHLFASELAEARSPGLLERARYVRSQWGENPHWVEYEGGGDDWYGFESIRLLPDLDGEIALIPLPGHTAGHCGVALNTADGWLLHCGDAFFFHGEIETPAALPARAAHVPEPEPARRQGAPPKPGAPAGAPARPRRRGDADLLT